MRKFIYIVLVSLLTLSFAGHGLGVQDRALEKLMQNKLQAAQKVLEGIALNDFEKIGKSADNLMDVSRSTAWKVVKTPLYEVHSNEFRRHLEGLSKAAKDKNVDAAALAYVELTLTCVRCHKHVREVRMTRGSDPELNVVAMLQGD